MEKWFKFRSPIPRILNLSTSQLAGRGRRVTEQMLVECPKQAESTTERDLEVMAPSERQ